MPLKYTQVEGRPVGLYLALLTAGASTAPTSVTVTVDTAGASAGANAIPITDPGTDIPKNTILVFDDAASTKVAVTADFASGSAGNLAVEAYDGADGDGIENALASGDAAAWDQLYTVVGTEDAPYSNNAQTQDLQAVVYGASSAINVSTPQVQSTAPQIARSGLFLAEGQLVQDLIQYADTNRNWWAKHVTPDSDGAAWLQREGVCRVTDLQQPAPANDLIRLSFNIRFVSAVPTITFPGAA